ncbi:hypothetical protein [Listeria sp. ILCC797]|uniref:hypothetical protein n=1 Tax=Listeria sp. ILCC797 TaxID=1918333 RepID=UPI000B58C0BD|nr:hypothetical protein [Listeria sp. ILCC797]
MVEKEKKELIFKGKTYTSYYQLEKVMGIHRTTIKYRHEKIGIPIDEVADYVAPPRIERFKGNMINLIASDSGSKKEKRKDFDMNEIIEYPETPQLYFSDSDPKRTSDSEKTYEKWLLGAPDILILREKNLHNTKLEELNESEKNSFFYASTYHEEAKSKSENALNIINSVMEKRKIN